MIQHRVGFRQLVALALARDDVEELRTGQFAQILQRRDQRFEIVAVRWRTSRAASLDPVVRQHQAEPLARPPFRC